MKALLAAIALGAVSFAALAQSSADDGRVDALVRKLGSTTYLQRELARKELEAIGPAALEPLRRASKSADAETRRRIAELIANFERQLLTRELLSPKKITLELKAARVDEALHALSKAAGYAVRIEASADKLADKRITLTAVDKPFWETLDAICAQAGLMEKVDYNQLAADSGWVRLTAKKGMRLAVVDPPSAASMATITLTERGTAKSIVSHAGAVKTELRVSRDPDRRELNLVLIVSPEPRMLQCSIEGKPLVEKIADERGQKLVESLPPPRYEAKKAGSEDVNDLSEYLTAPQRFLKRSASIKFKDADAPAKVLKELAGKLTLQFERQDQLLAKIPNVMQAAGKSVAGLSGGTMRLDSIRRIDDGDIEAQISMENLTQNPLGNIIVNGNAVIVRGVANRGWAGPNVAAGNANELPNLLDAKGQKCSVVNVTRETTSLINGIYSRSVTVIYRPGEGIEPAELVLHGLRGYTIDVPFRFENVPLPQESRTK